MQDEGDALIDQLRTALDHRSPISLALGILMERYDMDRDTAFALLQRISMHHNRKLYDVAVDFLNTRDLPD